MYCPHNTCIVIGSDFMSSAQVPTDNAEHPHVQALIQLRHFMFYSELMGRTAQLVLDQLY